MEDWLKPAAVAGIIAILVQFASVWLQRKKITVDDGASLRASLMEERKGLVSEIQSLSDRCKKLEDELQEAKSEIIELKTKNAELELEIAQLRAGYEKTDHN